MSKALSAPDRRSHHDAAVRDSTMLAALDQQPMKTGFLKRFQQHCALLLRGYLMAPPAVIARAAAEVMIIDRQGDPATEGAVAALMEDGEIRRHTRKVMRVYAERREILAALLRENFGGQLRFQLPDGGLAVWARFTEDCNMARLVEHAAHEKVRLLAGTAFSLNGTPTAALRLGFGSLNNEELTEGVRRLKVAVNSAFGGKAR